MQEILAGNRPDLSLSKESRQRYRTKFGSDRRRIMAWFREHSTPTTIAGEKQSGLSSHLFFLPSQEQFKVTVSGKLISNVELYRLAWPNIVSDGYRPRLSIDSQDISN